MNEKRIEVFFFSPPVVPKVKWLRHATIRLRQEW